MKNKEEHLRGVAKISEKWIVLENITNPKLKRVLHYRLRESVFNFFGGGYKEVNYQRKNHTDKWSNNHTDRHSDNYRDSHTDSHYDSPSDWPNRVYHSETHTDKSYNRGYSERIDRGYNEHTDHY